jgi:hypothetical protein
MDVHINEHTTEGCSFTGFLASWLTPSLPCPAADGFLRNGSHHRGGAAWWSSESGRSVIAAVAAAGCGGLRAADDAAVQFAGHRLLGFRIAIRKSQTLPNSTAPGSTFRSLLTAHCPLRFRPVRPVPTARGATPGQPPKRRRTPCKGSSQLRPRQHPSDTHVQEGWVLKDRGTEEHRGVE